MMTGSDIFKELKEARESFEDIRSILIHTLQGPGRAAFWAAVNARNRIDATIAAEQMAAAAIARAALAGKQITEYAERSTADVLYWKKTAEAANAALAKIRKVRDGYADQAKFADVEPAAWFREFVRRLDGAANVAGVAEQSGAGAPETSVQCGAPAAHLDIEECGNLSAGSPPR